MHEPETPSTTTTGTSEAPPALPDLGEQLRRVTVLGPRTPDDVTVLAGTGGKRATADEVRQFIAREQARIARERRSSRDTER